MQYILFVLRFFSFLLFLQKKEQKTKTKTHKQIKAHTKVNIESIFFYRKNSIFKIKKNCILPDRVRRLFVQMVPLT